MSRPKSKRIIVTRQEIEELDFIQCPLCSKDVSPWRVREILNSQVKFPELKGKCCPICRK